MHVAVQYSGWRENPSRTKTATLTFWIDPGVEEMLRTATPQQKYRYIANRMEVLIWDYGRHFGISVGTTQGKTVSDTTR